jgi:hypothetical protein
MAGDALIVATQDLYLDAGLCQRAHGLRSIAFRGIDEERKAGESKFVFVALTDCSAQNFAGRHTEHAIALFTPFLEAIEQFLPYLAVEGELRSVGSDIRVRARQDLLWCTLHHEQPCRTIVEQLGNAAALEIERDLVKL